ncbi:MAG: hypothetical protein A2504_00040 [Bdellovibrionales bacterium RIFOXYD12_FULL_39_22]|nr:MAG: hypothetical protein A2385_14985 [Bdellovibrionales bacterium RIFOXYB1_FULL_39_21]OFZ43744.1 MAG: hypothetical protein A2485_07810 [Bdellovibrionales bacterium RIFOXYC12_FULL_39_17]OFZ48085.1 MAG: hypothetical protein A2404_15680 [Bdellovibrionales bacterium RIFOXYC1_FULL_39_130]OFZ73779.1 MAG: hypothetical protein A2451_13605 [Bdellovibrionales bacterium RIFOXYC2_FULL_39_8]OFZ77252.1 MAG: hypothetical protein A2560_08305 [Bdellovibrionales bacterium RIFOXYD1_FULL_39_84]OFZ95688.1 MAG:
MKKRYILLFCILITTFAISKWLNQKSLSPDTSRQSISNDSKSGRTTTQKTALIQDSVNAKKSKSISVTGQERDQINKKQAIAAEEAGEENVDYLVDRYCDDGLSQDNFDSLVSYLQERTQIVSTVSDFENYEIVLPNGEHRRLQVALEELDSGGRSKQVYLFKLDADGLPERIDSDFQGAQDWEGKLSHFLKSGELLWKRSAGNMVLANNQVVFYELENGIITRLETLTTSGIAIGCMQEGEALVCNCE